MSLVVLDASVAVKWFLPPDQEPLVTEAFELLRAYSSGAISFAVPDLFWAEVGNFFWKAVRRKRFPMIARAQMESLRSRDFPTVPCAALIDSALELAVGFDRAVYDCLYIALAAQFRAEFITADERLANAVAARLPVKWLGAW